MKNSPFTYGNTVSDKSFTNREKEVSKLKSNLINGINTSIISPRRWGKSSLVEKVCQEIDRQHPEIKIILIDLFTISSQEEFLEAFAREVIKVSSSKWEEWLTNGKELFKTLTPIFSFGVDPQHDFRLSFDWVELKKNSDEILNLPEEIAKRKNIKIIVCLDEFQNLTVYKDSLNFEKKLRANWQRHKSVTYCLFGSKRHMMTEIFNNSSKPFYRFGDIMFLNKIERTKWTHFLIERFNDSGKSIEPSIAEMLPTIMKNHSWYVQQLAHYTWNLTSQNATILELNQALIELVQANYPLYQNEIEQLSITQVNLLRAICLNETKFTSAEVMKKYNLGTPRNVSKNKTTLIQKDLIHEIESGFEFLDPAFELWFREQFLNQPYDLI